MKIIKYQLATEQYHDVTVMVPLLDEDGNPVMKEIVDPVTNEVTYEPVMVEEIRQKIEVSLADVSIQCDTETSFQANLPIAEREAYNGEYTVEDDGQPEPDTTTTDDVLNALLGVTV